MQKKPFTAAQLAREALQTRWLKLEIHPDPKYLLPDPIETLEACEQLVKMGFIVMALCPCRPCLMQAAGRSWRSGGHAPWSTYRQ